MAEGPIRRACNRCHTQKLSCKRLGNEPCERCVRLKAECKSSPSLRFRKSNSSTTGANTSTSQQDHRSQKRNNGGLGPILSYSEAGIPYPGPDSFNGMAENLWPAHNVDAGHLIDPFDGNQIYQALPPQHVDCQVDQNMLFCRDRISSPMDDIPEPSRGLGTAPKNSTFLLKNDLTHLWVTNPSICYGPYVTEIARPNGLRCKDDAEAVPGIGTTLETLSPSQIPPNGVSTNNHLSGDASYYSSSHLTSKDCPPKHHAAHHIPRKTVSKSLMSNLCDISAQIWDMSNTITIVRSSGGNILEGMTVTHSSHGSARGSTQSDGQSPAGTPQDQCFPMGDLFAVSRNFIQVVQVACLDQNKNMTQILTNDSAATGDKTGDRVDAESFVVLANSTYAAMLGVYHGIFHIVDAIADSESCPPPSHNGSDYFISTSEGDLKQSLQSATASTSWKDTAALSCLKVFHFPDVSVGGFPIVSTPALQLGLGLRLADDFLSQFTNVVAMMQTCFSSTTHVESATVSALADQHQQSLPTVSTSFFPHPPLLVPSDLCAGDGFVGFMDWDASASTSTATSVSSSSGSNSVFSLQYGLDMHRTSLLDDVVRREHDVRQELAGLRNKLAT